MRASSGRAYLTAIPFLLLYAAQEMTVSTRVEDDATGIRSVRIVSRSDTKEYVRAFAERGKVRELLPETSLRRLASREVADSYRLTGDIRFVDGATLGDVKISRRWHLSWPCLQVAYTYTDRISRTEFSDTEREVAAAPKTELTYTVTMPGVVVKESVVPLGGTISGNTVSWKLKADKPTQDISVTAYRPDWAPTLFVALIILVAALSIARFMRYRERTTPQRI